VSKPPLHHIVRVRRSDDLTFLRAGIMDEVLINANQLENSPDSTATALRGKDLPFTVDPVLWRFQVPEWWRNAKGETKRNYTRLGQAYVNGTAIQIAAGPLLQTVPSDSEWRTLGANVIEYQRTRLKAMPAQLDLFGETQPRELIPTRFMAASLVAFTPAEDRINRLLVEAAASTAEQSVAVSVIVPPDRLLDARGLGLLLAAVPTDGVSAYFLWTPDITEDLMLGDPAVFSAILRLISSLGERGIPVGHLHAGYVIAALHDVGVAAVVHHLGWIDKGEPAAEPRGGLRSCQTYVPGVRHSIRFQQAHDLGRHLDAAAYRDRYCDCAFCAGAFANGEHPLDLLLEDQLVPFKDGRDRRTPTSRAVGLNTWHYLLARRQEFEAFSDRPAISVLDRDMARASALGGHRETDRLRRLAQQLRSA
jgi:hypothetical protein